MELWCIRVPEYARDEDEDEDDDEASRLKMKNFVSRLDDGSVENAKGTSSYVASPKLSQLFSPFMQTERLLFSSAARSCQGVSRETVDHDVTRHAYPEKCAARIAPIERSAGVLSGTWSFREDEATDEGKSSMSSRSEKVASKSDVSCKDTKVTSEAICEALRGLECYETECLAQRDERGGDYLERYDSDHHEWREDFQGDETDYQERYDVEESGDRASADCECSLSSSESNREDRDAADITDPLLAHELLTPYSRMPRPRLFRTSGEDSEYTTVVLPGRPRSPVRHILLGRFDLRSRTEELLKKRSIAEARRYLWKSKVRISQNVKQVLDDDVDRDSIVCMVVLQALCEQVTLTMAGTHTGIDVRTFVNTAIIWSLVDLQNWGLYELDKQEHIMLAELRSFSAQLRSREVVETVGTSKLRRALFGARRPEHDLCVPMQLLRCSLWAPVTPAYHRETVKSYPTVRDRIDERLSEESVCVRSTYLSDLTCYHTKEVSDESYATRKGKSKLLSGSNAIDRELDDLLIRFPSFTRRKEHEDFKEKRKNKKTRTFQEHFTLEFSEK